MLCVRIFYWREILNVCVMRVFLVFFVIDLIYVILVYVRGLVFVRIWLIMGIYVIVIMDILENNVNIRINVWKICVKIMGYVIFKMIFFIVIVCMIFMENGVLSIIFVWWENCVEMVLIVIYWMLRFVRLRLMGVWWMLLIGINVGVLMDI